ncbi:hypothetical protein JL720_13221 [Aureococcus anophagefferens]|nr:hypothetical protein JL720_13221 [Aureococcus anophagefferens]
MPELQRRRAERAHLRRVPRRAGLVARGQPGDGRARRRRRRRAAVRVRRDAVTWDRKSYFYPDLPKGFQITQKRSPLAVGGSVEILGDADARGGGETVAIGVESAHLEEDSAKLSYKGDTFDVDFNRSGCALVEIVSKPELRSGEEAARYARELQRTLQRVGASDGDMAAGSFRVDVNVSVAKDGDVALREKVEIKNLNSFRAVRGAVDHEVERQGSTRERNSQLQRLRSRPFSTRRAAGRLHDAGETVLPETRSWDGKKTAVLRAKGGAEAYRFAPEPDLPPRRSRSSIDRTLPACSRRRRRPRARRWRPGRRPPRRAPSSTPTPTGRRRVLRGRGRAAGGRRGDAWLWRGRRRGRQARARDLRPPRAAGPRGLVGPHGRRVLGRRRGDLLPAARRAPRAVRAEVADRDLGQIADAAALDAFVADVPRPTRTSSPSSRPARAAASGAPWPRPAARGPAGLNAALDRALPR